MKKARIIGSYIEQLAKEKGITDLELSKILKCERQQIKLLMKGRVLLSFDQLLALVQAFGISISNLTNGDIEHYNRFVVNCINPFSNINNREIILDLIDEYLDVLDAVK